MKEKKYIALQIACGDITDSRQEKNAFVIASEEKFILSVLEKPENKKIIEEALKWQGVNLPLVIERKIKLSELQEQDLQKLKSLGLEVKIEEGE